jgi:flagellar hook-associated protein 2
MLTSNATGADNAIAITNGLAADSGGARRPELAATYVGNAVTSTAYTGTSTPTANTGAGSYTGNTNKTYTFTILTGGTVGASNGIQIGFADSTGANSGTITLNSGDQDVFKSVAEGLQVKLGAGALVAGETFSIDAFVPTVQQAASASVTLGSGTGALTVQSDTNRVDGLINGVTVNLLATDPAKEVQLTVANDTKSASKAIVDFVDSYNDLMAFIDKQIQYDAETSTAGVLLGNRSVTVIQDQLRRVVGDLVGGVNGQANRLGALGITTNSAGLLDVNQSKLDSVLTGGVSGVSFNDVRRLFALAGESTSGGVQFVVGGVRTKASATPYQVDVSQAAERGAITATNPLAASTVLNNSNNTLTVTIDGKTSGTITLGTGTYTRLGLAQELEAQINANADLAGRRVAVSLDAAGSRLVISSQTYGLSSEVTVGTGTALTALGLSGSETDKGQDVVGKFIVDGVDEPGVGSGQFLVGDSTNANTADLQVRVTLGGSQIVNGPEASLNVTRGVASKLDVILSGLLDPVTGRLKTVNDGFQASVDDLEKSVKRQNDFMELRRQALVKQFAALEGNISRLKNTGDFLAAQLTSSTKK